jgi:hypothetical protein
MNGLDVATAGDSPRSDIEIAVRSFPCSAVL